MILISGGRSLLKKGKRSRVRSKSVTILSRGIVSSPILLKENIVPEKEEEGKEKKEWKVKPTVSKWFDSINHPFYTSFQSSYFAKRLRERIDVNGSKTPLGEFMGDLPTPHEELYKARQTKDPSNVLNEEVKVLVDHWFKDRGDLEMLYDNVKPADKENWVSKKRSQLTQRFTEEIQSQSNLMSLLKYEATGKGYFPSIPDEESEGSLLYPTYINDEYLRNMEKTEKN